MFFPFAMTIIQKWSVDLAKGCQSTISFGPIFNFSYLATLIELLKQMIVKDKLLRLLRQMLSFHSIIEKANFCPRE